MLRLALVSLIPLAAAQDFAARADAYVASWVRDGQFQGAVLVAREGKPLFRRGYGWANAEWDIPNGADVKYRLGSITKQFTAVAVLQLAEQGKLKLDDPVSRHYDNAPAAWEKVTIHHLLTHTSGIPSYTALPGFFEKRARERMTTREVVELTQNAPLEFEPGTKYKYNNTAYVLLGHIIEKLAGMNYADYVRTRVLEPAGMFDSGYDTAEQVIRRRASGYSADGRNAPFIDMSLPHAAGALYSTADDLVKWTEALGSGKLLSPESYRKMTTPFLDNYGYGLIVRDLMGKRVEEHGGGIFGFNTHLLRVPAERLAVVVLANRNTPGAGKIAHALLEIFEGKDVPPRPVRVEVTLTPQQLDALAGEYELRPGFILKVWRAGNQLMTQATGQQPLPVFALSETRFFPKAVDAELEFERDAQGRATAVVLRQAGQELKGPRK